MDNIEDDSWKNLMKYASGNSSNGFRGSPELGSAARKRILIEFQEIENDNMLFIRVALSKHSIGIWNVVFPAPNGKAVKATLYFGSEYPFQPPEMYITQRIFHPNISSKGKVCFENNYWSPAHSIWSLITSVQCLLSDPNPMDPVNGIASKMLLETPEAYHKYALECFEMLDFFSDEGEDCSKTDENNSFVKVEPNVCQDDEEIYKLEEDLLIQHLLQNMYLN